VEAGAPVSARSKRARGSLGFARALAGVISPQERAARADTEPPWLHLFELRRYATKPGERERLLDLFEGDFLDAYEAGGTRVLASFRALDDPDLWVWIRAFPDAERRGPALQRFYASESWKQGRDACNATIAGVHDAFLLRLAAGAGLPAPPVVSREPGAEPPESIYAATIVPLAREGADAFRELFEREAMPLLTELGGRPTLVLTTDRSPNSFPGQPVSDETVLVTFTRFENTRAEAAFMKAQRESARWRETIEPALARLTTRAPETLRLRPTARSPLR
jgi:hypothetical protein